MKNSFVFNYRINSFSGKRHHPWITTTNILVCIIPDFMKTRNEKTAIRPMEAVDFMKTEKLETTAKNFILYTKLDAEMRFDVCEVYVDDDNKLKNINYIENAF